MSARPYPWERPETDSYPDMNYLLSEGARTRYVIAAHYLRDCPVVVEIGGFKTPVTGYLTDAPKRVLMVDPIVPEYHAQELHGSPCRIDHVRARFQEYAFDLPEGEYGLVCLGLSLKHFGADDVERARQWAKWLDLVGGSRVAIIEFAVDWALGRELGHRTLAETRGELVVQMDMDLSESPGMDTVHARRRLIVLRPGGAP